MEQPFKTNLNKTGGQGSPHTVQAAKGIPLRTASIITLAFFTFSSMAVQAETLTTKAPGSNPKTPPSGLVVGNGVNASSQKAAAHATISEEQLKTLSFLHQSSKELSRMAFSAFSEAYKSYSAAVSSGKIKKGKFIVVDYTQKSNTNRFYLVDFDSMILLGAIKVAHGEGNGDLVEVTKTSNVVGSHATPSGLMKIEFPNKGSWKGWQLSGLDTSNSNTLKRYILIHGMNVPYAAENSYIYVNTLGCLGLNPWDAIAIGLPLQAEANDSDAKEWVGRGVYVWYSAKN